MSIRRTGAPPGVRERSPLRGRVRRISGSLAFVLIAEAALLATAGTGTTAVADDSPAAGSSATSLGAAEAQDEASALLMARLQNRRIEVLSERTSTATTWALPDGTLRTDTYAGPAPPEARRSSSESAGARASSASAATPPVGRPSDEEISFTA